MCVCVCVCIFVSQCVCVHSHEHPSCIHMKAEPVLDKFPTCSCVSIEQGLKKSLSFVA